jgi:hypothetical protein
MIICKDGEISLSIPEIIGDGEVGRFAKVRWCAIVMSKMSVAMARSHLQHLK